MLMFPYRFAITLFAEDGTEFGSVPVECDWEPVHEWTRLHFQRRGVLSPDFESERASVVPLWHETQGEPYCHGFRLQISQDGRSPVAVDFPNSFFRETAITQASRLAHNRKLLAYTVAAHPASIALSSPGGLRIRETAPRLPVQAGAIGGFLTRARSSGVLDADDLPVFVAQQVLDEFAVRTHRDAGTETGGILIGRLWQDADAEIFVEVSAVIPLEHAAGSRVKLTFTPESWTAAEAALQLRGRGEIYLGFAHSHPVFEWCRSKGCSAEAQRECLFAKDFFSADDEGVLRAAFPRAYSIGLVANHTAFGLSFSMFGNRRGVVKPRGFYVLEETHDAESDGSGE